MTLLCGECPVWEWGYQWWDNARSVPCDRYVSPRRPDDPCIRHRWTLIAEATRLRCIADALDKAAEMREREEAQG